MAAVASCWPSLQGLQDADYSYFGRLAGYLEKISFRAQTALQDLAEDVKCPSGVDWEGEAGDAAIAQAAADLVKARPVMWSWDDVAASTRRWQDELEAGTRTALDAVDDAERDGFTVNPDYSVSDNRRSATEGEFEQRLAAAEAHSSYIRHQLSTLVGNESRINGALKVMTAEWGTLTFPESGGAKAEPIDRTTRPQEPPPEDNSDPPWKDQSPPKNWEDIKKILDQLQRGENKPNRQLDTPEEIKDFWDWLSKGAKGDLPSPGFPRKVFDDGTEIGMRPDSKSGGPTVEFTPPDSKRLPKVHLPLPPPPPAAPPVAAPPAAAPESPGPSVASQIEHDLESAGRGIWTVVVIGGSLLGGIFGGTGGRLPAP